MNTKGIVERDCRARRDYGPKAADGSAVPSLPGK